MATVTVIDYRRTDLRTNVLANPYWITSGLVSAVAADDLYALLFSFPVAGKITKILDVVVQVVAALTASSTIDIGYCSLATDAITTGGVGTTIEDAGYVANTDIAITANTFSRVTTGNGSTWLTQKLLDSGIVAPLHLTGAAATVPCVMALTARTGAISAGTYRVHMLIHEVPGSF